MNFIFKITSIFLFLLVSICNTSAQLINVKPSDVWNGEINFNPEIIKKNKVKSISIAIVDKPDGDIITDKGESKGYEFDANGYMTRHYYTFIKKTEQQEKEIPAVKKNGKIISAAETRTVTKYINDTVFVYLFYDTLNRIIIKRSGIGDYYDAYYYEYDEQGKVKKELHCKETNVSAVNGEFILGVQSILSRETFEYKQQSPTQYKKKCFNDEGREYKKGIINYDKSGNKISEYYEFMVSWMRQEKKYSYDETGKLIAQSIISNDSGEKNEHLVYQYTKDGNLLNKIQFEGIKLVYETNYMYDENAELIKSEVNRNHRDASIDIVKYSYSFY